MPAASPSVFVLRRLLTVAGVVLVTASASFLFFHVMRREAFSDPRPLLEQLSDYLKAAVLHGDLGRSWERPNPEVADLLRKGLPGDVALLAGSLVLGVVGGTAGGAICATRPTSFTARCLAFLAAVALCAPVYWVGLMAVLVFTPGVGPLGTDLFPVNSTYAGLTEDPVRWFQALSVPWIILALPVAAMSQRMMSASMREVLDEDYLRTAAAKGLHPRTDPAAARRPGCERAGDHAGGGEHGDDGHQPGAHRAGLQHPGRVPPVDRRDGEEAFRRCSRGSSSRAPRSAWSRAWPPTCRWPGWTRACACDDQRASASASGAGEEVGTREERESRWAAHRSARARRPRALAGRRDARSSARPGRSRAPSAPQAIASGASANGAADCRVRRVSAAAVVRGVDPTGSLGHDAGVHATVRPSRDPGSTAGLGAESWRPSTPRCPGPRPRGRRDARPPGGSRRR